MLIDLLIREQRAEGLSDSRFAEKLGISRQLWQFARSGRRRVGEKFIRGIIRAYPEFIPDLLIFLRGDVTIGGNKVTLDAERSDSPH